MKSRRRIAFSKAQDHANTVADYSKDLRSAKWVQQSICAAKKPELPMSALGHKRTLQLICVMSALCQKRTFVDWPQHCRSTGASDTGAVSTGRTIFNKAPYLPPDDAVS
jgi:hypothetical protein